MSEGSVVLGVKLNLNDALTQIEQAERRLEALQTAGGTIKVSVDGERVAKDVKAIQDGLNAKKVTAHADYTQIEGLEKALLYVNSALANTRRLFSRSAIVPKVDLNPLKELNKELDRKQKHWIQTQRLFAGRPLVRQQNVGLGQLNRLRGSAGPAGAIGGVSIRGLLPPTPRRTSTLPRTAQGTLAPRALPMGRPSLMERVQPRYSDLLGFPTPRPIAAAQRGAAPVRTVRFRSVDDVEAAVKASRGNTFRHLRPHVGEKGKRNGQGLTVWENSLDNRTRHDFKNAKEAVAWANSNPRLRWQGGRAAASRASSSPAQAATRLPSGTQAQPISSIGASRLLPPAGSIPKVVQVEVVSDVPARRASGGSARQGSIADTFKQLIDRAVESDKRLFRATGEVIDASIRATCGDPVAEAAKMRQRGSRKAVKGTGAVDHEQGSFADLLEQSKGAATLSESFKLLNQAMLESDKKLFQLAGEVADAASQLSNNLAGLDSTAQNAVQRKQSAIERSRKDLLSPSQLKNRQRKAVEIEAREKAVAEYLDEMPGSNNAKALSESDFVAKYGADENLHPRLPTTAEYGPVKELQAHHTAQKLIPRLEKEIAELRARPALPQREAQKKYRTVKAVEKELARRGGYMETIRDTEKPEYAPHLFKSEKGWEHGLFVKEELLAWANKNLQDAKEKAKLAATESQYTITPTAKQLEEMQRGFELDNPETATAQRLKQQGITPSRRMKLNATQLGVFAGEMDHHYGKFGQAADVLEYENPQRLKSMQGLNSKVQTMLAQSKAGDTAQLGASVGKDAASGLAKGVGSGVVDIAKAAEELSDSLINALKNDLEIRSPSRVMMRIGRQAAEGFILGFRNAMSELRAEAGKISDQIANERDYAIKASGAGMDYSAIAEGIAGQTISPKKYENRINQIGVQNLPAEVIGEANSRYHFMDQMPSVALERVFAQLPGTLEKMINKTMVKSANRYSSNRFVFNDMSPAQAMGQIPQLLNPGIRQRVTPMGRLSRDTATGRIISQAEARRIGDGIIEQRPSSVGGRVLPLFNSNPPRRGTAADPWGTGSGSFSMGAPTAPRTAAAPAPTRPIGQLLLPDRNPFGVPPPPPPAWTAPTASASTASASATASAAAAAASSAAASAASAQASASSAASSAGMGGAGGGGRGGSTPASGAGGGMGWRWRQGWRWRPWWSCSPWIRRCSHEQLESSFQQLAGQNPQHSRPL